MGLQWYEHGRHGIVHQLAVEKGFIRPGELFAFQDSHTTGSGALNCAGRGVGDSEMVYVLAKGETWFPVGECIKVDLRGNMSNFLQT